MILNKLKWILVIFTLIFSGYWYLLEFPSFLYSHKYINDNLVIHSDKAIPKNIKTITDEVLIRLKRSELYSAEQTYNVYIPTEYWRWGIVSMPIYYQNAGAFCIGNNHNVFFRPSDIAGNKLIPPSGKLADAQERDLIYFITHEVGHALMFERVGVIPHFRDLPKWLREGYPDYIAKESFDFEDNLDQFNNNEWRLTEKSGLYVRYHLFVYLLLDKEGYSLKQLIDNAPDKSEILNLLKAYSDTK